MRRLVVGLVLASVLAVSAPVSAASAPAAAFIDVILSSTVGDSLTALSSGPTDTAGRLKLRAAIATDRAALAAIVPDACVLSNYVGWLDVLTLGEASLDLYDQGELTASTAVLLMMTDRINTLDPDALFACAV